MPGHQEVSVAAAGLHISVETLVEFDRKGWIKTAEKNGMVYLTADQRYRAKFILHLRDKKHLGDEQIELVLSVQRPPYSAAQVDEILRKHPPAPGKDERAKT
jgi:DNA-binding transcriptional MerR regulator